jgi:hypothetical protein
MPSITLIDFAQTFGCSIGDFSQPFLDHFKATDWSYEIPSPGVRDEIVLNILRKIENDQQVIGAPERTKVWHNGWKENLDAFLEKKNLDQIVPKFIRPNKIIRYNGGFIAPQNPYFERDFARLIQIYIYDRFIAGKVKNVYEFGSGSCFNLVALMELDTAREIKFFGSDFVQSSVDLCNQIGAYFESKTGVNVLRGDLFNMKYPNYDYQILPDSCVFTFGAIEQLASEFHHFLHYLIKQRPRIIFHVEPVVENYNPDDLFDHLQIRFHEKRGYTKGLLPSIQYLASQGVCRLVDSRRLNFGSEMFEGYHLIAWELV